MGKSFRSGKTVEIVFLFLVSRLWGKGERVVIHVYIYIERYITYSKNGRYFECTICICFSKHIHLHMYYRYIMRYWGIWQAFKPLICCIMSYLKMLIRILYIYINLSHAS